jgi:hypothetical protein
VRLTVYPPSPLRARLHKRFGQYTGGRFWTYHANGLFLWAKLGRRLRAANLLGFPFETVGKPEK